MWSLWPRHEWEPIIVQNFFAKAIKFVVAFLLLPLFPPVFLGIWSYTRGISERTLFLQNPLSLCAGGLLLWVVFALLFRLPPRLYVLAHELTHAIFIKLCGGKVKKISIQRDSGYVLSDSTNFLIVLAPYLFPFYAILMGMVGVAVSFLPSPTWVDVVVWVSIGFCLGYHLTMTGRMMMTRQTDFSSQGYFFSFVFILLTNGAMFLVLLVLLPSSHGAMSRFQSLGGKLAGSYVEIWRWMAH